ARAAAGRRGGCARRGGGRTSAAPSAGGAGRRGGRRVRAAPVRTCVGCGRRSPQAELVRFVARQGRLVLDPRRRLGGRGAWLHRLPGCWGEFVERRGGGRRPPGGPARPPPRAPR